MGMLVSGVAIICHAIMLVHQMMVHAGLVDHLLSVFIVEVPGTSQPKAVVPPIGWDSIPVIETAILVCALFSVSSLWLLAWVLLIL
jgi:hypothetical protein